jgi:arginyl-tRNA synthetase
VIPGDIGTALGVTASGTWRPAPPGSGQGPGTYATSLPFRLARVTGREPGQVAAELAARLRPVPWIEAASVTGRGYLTVTVTPRALAALAVRVPAAGTACASSDALRGTCLEAPATADPASAGDWAQAWLLATAAMTGRLAAAAGATVKTTREPERSSSPALAPAAAVVAGGEAVRYALARSPAPPAVPGSPETYVLNDLDNPYFMVRYAHARAASVLRWAADLGIGRGAPEEFRPELLGQARERELLGAISWLPERVAGAARRRRPGSFARHLESLAGAWLGCSEHCPALPFGGRSAPRDPAGMAARLWLAAAARTALAAGLRLADIEPPERL